VISDYSGQLPIIEVLDALREACETHDELVLQAPPGAGKTTLVPLALLDQPWLAGQTILMLEPRRMAAMAAATRMAQMLGEKVGDTVGYRIRLDQCVGARTRIEVITEGILTRRMQSDPSLEGVGLVIFDEFHERNLNSDLGLALALHGRMLFREGLPLKILLMSATLDGAAAAALLGGAPIVTSLGRQFPVSASYGRAMRLRDSIVQPTVETVMRALQEQQGNLLVFLPGASEIRQVATALANALPAMSEERVVVASLYGGLSLPAQQEAIQDTTDGVRKIVLATNIAETSLTIEGINTVVDSGRVREAVFDSSSGMTRLTTRRISRASALQRMGRAGRLAQGHCYRLWSEEQHAQLTPHSTAEILQADLAPVTLQLLAWGVEDVTELAWLDTPPPGPYKQSLAMLENCGAVVKTDNRIYQLTSHGLHMAELPLHPRLSHMILVGCEIGELDTACLLAALLGERNPLSGNVVDISHTLSVLKGERVCEQQYKGWLHRAQKQAKRYRAMAVNTFGSEQQQSRVEGADVSGVLLASAYPDRVAKLRSNENGTEYQLANGRTALLPQDDQLVGLKWLAVAEVGGRVGERADRIYSAASLNAACFRDALTSLVKEVEFVQWDERAGKFIAEQRRQVGRHMLSSTPMIHLPQDTRIEALADVVRKKGLGILPWSKSIQQWRSRVQLLHDTEINSAEASSDKQPGSRWPDLSDQHLLLTLNQWLSPYLSPVHNMGDFQRLDLKSILHTMLPWPLPLDLERLAPERFTVPSGSSVVLDYTQSPPVLEVKLQEMFGCDETPSIAGGQVQLMVHLLSPAQRPLQITQDLAGFWRSSYQDVKKEMKGRYPKHPWPDNPLTAEATRYTKQRIKGSA
jgi:ATP-dependent helicase HrpB